MSFSVISFLILVTCTPTFVVMILFLFLKVVPRLGKIQSHKVGFAAARH